MPLKLKNKVYKKVIKLTQALPESWVFRKKDEQRIQVEEMRMWWWLQDRTGNDHMSLMSETKKQRLGQSTMIGNFPGTKRLNWY